MAIDAGTILAALDLDTSKFINALHTAQNQLAGFKGNGIEGALTSIGSAAVTSGRMLTMGVTTPLAGAATAAIKWAGDVEASANKVATIADTSVVSMDKLQAGVMRLSNDTGIAASDLNEALYQTISATNDTANAIAYTSIAAQAAKGGFTDTSTAIDGLTGVMNAYGLKGEAAMRAVADQMPMAQNFGKTSFGEIAGSIGNVIPLAATLNVGTDELFASIATLTKQSIGTSEAITGMKAAFSNIIKPSAEAAKEAKKLGIDFSATALQSKGLAGFLQDVMDKTGGNIETMSMLFGSTEAVNNILALTSETGAKDFAGAMDAMADSAGATQAAYDQMQEGFNAGLTKLLNSGKNLAISFGNILLPVATDVVGFLSRGVSAITGLDDGVKRLIVKAGAMAAAAGPVLLVGGKLLSTFGGLVAPLGLVAAGFTAAYNIFPEFAGVVDSGIAAVQDFGRSLIDGQSITEAFAGAITRNFGNDALGAIISFKTSASRHFGDAVNEIKSSAIGMGDALRAEAAAIKTDWSEGGALGALAGFGERMADRIREALPAIGEAALGIRDKIGEGIHAGVEWFVPKARTMLGNLGTALGNAKAYATEHLPAVRDAIADGLQVAKTKLSTMAQTALGNLSTAYLDAKAYAVEHLPAVRDAIADGLQIAKAKLTTTAQIVMANLGTALGNAKDYVTYHLPAIRSSIADGLQVAKTTLIAKAQDAMTWLGEAYRSPEVQALLGDISGVATTIAGKISVTKEHLIGKAGELLQKLGEALGTDEAKAKITEITGVVAAIAGNITSTAGAWQATATAMITDLVTQLTDNGFLATLLGDDTHGLGGVVTAIAGGIGTAASNIASAASDIGGALIGGLTADDGKLISDLFTNASTVVSAIGGKIVDAAGSITASATSLATNLLSGLNDIDWATLGTQVGISLGGIAGSLINGIITNAPKVIDNAGPLVDAIGAGIANAGTALGSAAGELIGSIVSWSLSGENWGKLLALGGTIVAGIGQGVISLGKAALLGAENFLSETIDGIVENVLRNMGVDTTPYVESVNTLVDEFNTIIYPNALNNILAFNEAVHERASFMWQGISEGLEDSAWMTNEAVTKLFGILLDTARTEADRATAAAALQMAGFGPEVAKAIANDKGDVATEATKLFDAGVGAINNSLNSMGVKLTGTVAEGVRSTLPTLELVADEVANTASGVNNRLQAEADAKTSGENVTTEYAAGADSKTGEVETSGQAVYNSLYDEIKGMPDDAKQVGADGMQGLATSIDDGASEVESAMSGAASGAIYAAASQMSYGEGYSIGVNTIDGMINGVASRAGALANRMRELARSAVRAAKRALDINSPSGVMEREVGAWLPGGIGVGVARNMQDALGPLDEVRRSMVGVFDDTLGGVRLGTPDVPWAPAGGYGGGTPVVHIEITGDWQVRSDDDRDEIINALYERISEQLRRR